MKTEVGVRGFFIFFLLFSPLKNTEEAPNEHDAGRNGSIASPNLNPTKIVLILILITHL